MEIWLVSPRGRRGSVTGTTAGMMEGFLDFCKNKNPISYQLIKCIRLAKWDPIGAFKVGVLLQFEHSISKTKS